MIQFPNCKINLGLSIIAKRTDGFHNLETVFYPVGLNDIVEIIPAPNASKNIDFSHTGIDIPGTVDNNLCIKAYELLKKAHPSIPNIKMHLHKHIPMGAGLGGGSSDGTAVLKILNALFNLNIPLTDLSAYAAQLGSDCPYFLYDQACHAIGRGEILTPIELDLAGFQIALLHPGIHVNTGWAFSKLNPHEKQNSILEIVQQPIESWKQYLINDFETAVFDAHPIIGELKTYLYNHGAIYASMSGSGSTVFGIFPKEVTIPKPPFANDIRVDVI